MNNFQLYRTNPLLSGQLKWDIILDAFNNDLCVSDFHLSPISHNIPSIYNPDEYLIKNSHQDNVKEFYSANRGHFYSEGLDYYFYGNWPIISDKKINPYSDIYDMGCRRPKSFKKYKRQFEYLCPMWIEQLTDIQSLIFKINVKYIDSDTIIASKTLSLSNNGHSFHNEFSNYFKDYIRYVGISNGNDDVIDISFEERTSEISGLNAASGLFEKTNTITLTNNLISGEKPLMEFDNIISNHFKDNYMICAQLFNFNLCFNLEDIMPKNTLNLMTSHDIKITVDTYINDIALEKRDFYTEYEFIEKEIMSTNKKENTKRNVLDYLKDYNYIDFIDKNKFCQSTCHWSLNDDAEYIFNLYEGFSGISIDDNDEYDNKRQYGLTPDIHTTSYVKSKNNVNWINFFDIKSLNQFKKYIDASNKNKYDATLISKSNKFINNLLYSNIPDELDNKYIMSMYISNSSLYKSVAETLKKHNAILLNNSDKNPLYLIECDGLIIFVSTEIDFLTYRSIYKILNDSNSSNQLVKDIFCLMNNVVSPHTVIFYNDIAYSNAISPNGINSKEISYHKRNVFSYLFRYDGKIKPTFTTKKSTLYYKDYGSTSKLLSTEYHKYSESGFEPTYPSLGYCAIKKIDEYDYNVKPKIQAFGYADKIDLLNEFEHTWFDDNKYIVLKNDLTLEYIQTKEDGYETLDDIVFKLLGKYYNTDDKEKIEYIKSLYEYKNMWEYMSDTNVDDYKYTIRLTLK